MEDKRDAREDYSCWKIGGMIVRLKSNGSKEVCERSSECLIDDCDYRE